MKKLNINLSDLSGRELSAREKLSLKGGDMQIGDCCLCGCCYEGEPGGSSQWDNMVANYNEGKNSICPSENTVCWISHSQGGWQADHCSLEQQ
jgi:hypothetical protein